MRPLDVTAAALNQTPLDWSGNRRRIREAIDRARRAGSSLLCLPELCITGYGCEDAFLSPDVERRARESLGALLPHTEDIAVAIGLPMRQRGVLYNATAIAVDGDLVGVTAKRNLAGDGVHYEPRWFKPWPDDVRHSVAFDGREVPFGDLVFEVDGVRFGLEICEDAWVADRPGSRLAERGVDVVMNPSASHFAFDKQTIRQRFVLDGSRAFGVTYLYANLLGNEAGRIVYDGGTMIASGGDMLARGPRFSYEEVELVHARVDVDETRTHRAELASYSPAPPDEWDADVRVEDVFDEPEPEPSPRATSAEPPTWATGDDVKEEEFTRAVCLGLFDYLRKSGMSGFVVSLSGGADSSATSVLVATMVRLAVDELGVERFRERLERADLEGASTPEALTDRLLTCAYQATRNSSETTRDAAETVARAIGATYHELDIDELVDGYTELVEEALDRDLGWETDDIALQNIQARARAPSIWMIANVEDALLLAPSNRSEAAVGYTTMDGDTCGGLAPIAGIDKHFLRRWLAWMRDRGPEGLDPIPELEKVTAQQPTAELRPEEEGQTDEGDLMPYEVLDAIERAAILDRHGPSEVHRAVGAQFEDVSDARMAAWVKKFYRLWARNQWKRERYAPSFHLDDENLDPKTWCRFPILSGGFEDELAELP